MRSETSTTVDACPAGWLLEALAGHRLDGLLFPRRSLRWRYYPRLWVILEDAKTPEGRQLPCDCFRTNRHPFPLGHLPKSDCDAFIQEVRLLAAVVWQRRVERRNGIPTSRGRIPPDRIRVVCHECLFWAGACSECGTIHWTLGPWVERPEDKYEAMHRGPVRRQADKAKEPGS